MTTPVRASLSRDLSILRGTAYGDSEVSQIRQILHDNPDIIDFELTKVSKSKAVKRKFQINLVKRIMKWKANSQFHFQHVKKIRYLPEDTISYQLQLGIQSPYWITIVYYNYNKSPNLKIMHLIAGCKEEFHLFLNLILKLTSLSNGGVVNLKNLIESSDFHTISKNDMFKLLEFWNLNLNYDQILRLSKTSILDRHHLSRFVHDLSRRNELSNVINELGIHESNKKSIKLPHFIKFVREIQCEDLSIDEITKTFNRIVSNDSKSDNAEIEMTLEQLYYYISEQKPLETLHNDLNKPLNEYFISSSHNTYLLGKQIHGKSSIEGYIQALQRGCRCLEIDIWDSELEPLVTHGRSFTDSITLESVLECINRYAFWYTDLPLILSLEIQCNSKNQMRCIEALKNTFGDQLVLDYTQFGEILPTPNELRNKVLLKIKRSSKKDVSSKSSLSNTLASLSMSTEDLSSNSLSSSSSAGSSSFSSSPSPSSSPSSLVSTPINKIAHRIKVIPDLTNLAPYLIGVKYRNFSLPESKTFNHIFSFGDKRLSKMTSNEEKLKSIIKHNKNFMMRVYPSITRFNSNNFLPLLFWDIGVQMVATNWQIWDIGEELNESLFKHTMGYYLKPKVMRDSQRNKEVLIGRFQRIKKCKLSLEIINANELIKPINQDTISPHIEIELYNITISGHIGGDLKAKFSNTDEPSVICISSAVENDGFKPKWNSKLNLEYFTNLNELGFIRFVIKSQKTVIATYSCRIHDLKRGFRVLKLLDVNGEEFTNSTLFIRVH